MSEKASEKEKKAFFLRHPQLECFELQLSDFKSSFKIGHGNFCSVEEVAIPGAMCAAKRFRDDILKGAKKEEIKKAEERFENECQLMSTLRHPNIVQFLGIAFFPGSPLPALVMERLLMTLQELLVPDPSRPANDPIPLRLKCNILHNIACGLVYLHQFRPKPIIHRNLSAGNVLLNSEMVAKIGGLTVACTIASERESALMTQRPGDMLYMPPEATRALSEYDASIDIFSLGVLTILVIGEKDPKDPIPPTYVDENTGLLGARTELERRSEYMQYVNEQLCACGQLRGDHPLIRLIQQCLQNKSSNRPGIREVLHLLEEARAGVRDEHIELNKLKLVQHLLQKEAELHKSDEERRHKETELVQAKDREIALLQQQLGEKDELTRKEAELTRKEAELTRAEETIRREQQQIQEKRQRSHSQARIPALPQPSSTTTESPASLSDLPTLPLLQIFPKRSSGVINIIQEVTGKNHYLSICLLNDSNGTITDNIECKHKDDPTRITETIFQNWLQGTGRSPQSWKTLITVLKEIEHTALAEEIYENIIS